LATFQRDTMSERFFLLSGLGAAIGTGYALDALWREAGMDPKALFTLRPPEGSDSRFAALIFLTWSMIFFVVVYIAMLFAS
jgi:hypothetical protein